MSLLDRTNRRDLFIVSGPADIHQAGPAAVPLENPAEVTRLYLSG